METIRFDDIEKLKSKVSQEFSDWSEPIEVTQDKINQFAEVTGDHQWIHIDIERTKLESPFKGPVAHGFLTLSLIPAFEVPRVTSFRSFVNYGANKLRFISPIPAGAKVHARSRVLAV
jgi:acyl dehydratase